MIGKAGMQETFGANNQLQLYYNQYNQHKMLLKYQIFNCNNKQH